MQQNVFGKDFVNRKIVYALHGFLGNSGDWPKQLSIEGWIPLDLYRDLGDLSQQSLWHWGREFNQWIQLQHNRNDSLFLMGYSLGGRLALHACLQENSPWSGAICISTHLGLSNPLERKERLQSDLKKAEELRKDPKSFLQAWENQPIFRNGSAMPTRSFDSKETLFWSNVLQNFSLGKQKCSKSQVKSSHLPFLWMVGEKDPSQGALLAKELNFSHPQSRLRIAPSAGHRIPWDNPSYVEGEITSWFQALSILYEVRKKIASPSRPGK